MSGQSILEEIPNDKANAIPPFILKLWRLIEDPDTNDLIFWSSSGKSFVINDQRRFSTEILPKNYKHNNMSSFIRLLNIYDFHKVTSIDSGALVFDKDDLEFSHPCFQRHDLDLLKQIKRKKSKPKEFFKNNSELSENSLKVYQEIQSLKEILNIRFSNMHQENQALQKEINLLKEIHSKQQQTIEKILQLASDDNKIPSLIDKTEDNSNLNKTARSLRTIRPKLNFNFQAASDFNQTLSPNMAPCMNNTTMKPCTITSSLCSESPTTKITMNSSAQVNEPKRNSIPVMMPATPTLMILNKPLPAFFQTVKNDGPKMIYCITGMKTPSTIPGPRTANQHQMEPKIKSIAFPMPIKTENNIETESNSNYLNPSVKSPTSTINQLTQPVKKRHGVNIAAILDNSMPNKVLRIITPTSRIQPQQGHNSSTIQPLMHQILLQAPQTLLPTEVPPKAPKTVFPTEAPLTSEQVLLKFAKLQRPSVIVAQKKQNTPDRPEQFKVENQPIPVINANNTSNLRTIIHIAPPISQAKQNPESHPAQIIPLLAPTNTRMQHMQIKTERFSP